MNRNARDVYAGLLFMVFGVVALVMAQAYTVGTAARMGPGYFPRLLGILLIVLGALQCLVGLRARSTGPLDWQWRPLFVLLASVALFILLTPWIGLIAAGLTLVFVSSAASREFHWREALIAGAILGAIAAALFVRGLGVPLPIWPAFVGGA